MASQEEDNKLECISNVNREQEIYCLNVYKKYDTILNNKTESFETKVKSLIEVWKSIADLNLADFDIRYVIQIIEWAKLHALNIVLTGEWRSTKEEHCKSLLGNIERAQNKLLNVNNAFSTRCQKLADVVKKPWEDPVLTNMLHTKEAEIGAPEIEFFCVETAYLVSVRLKKLCESQCEDLALNLVTNFLNYTKLATTHNFNINATATQMWFIFDIYMALLYKFQDRKKMVQNFQELQLHEGLQLVKRFAKKRVKISKIWRNCHRIAIYGSRFFLSKALMKYTDDLKEFLIDLLKTYISLSSTDTLLNEFVTSVRSITNLADALGLCVMCEVIHREAGDKLRHFIIEMYIRALTTDMNELERLKHVQDTDKVASTTSRLANTFSNLADLLNDHVKVSRECVLTAFSLEPTKERLKRIEELAEKSGFQVLDTGQEWKCRLHPPMLPSDDIAWMCAECGDWMNKPELSAPVKINMALNEALQGSVLGISDSLCDDLVVCLSNPRYQVLSWLLPWGDLYRLCVMYLSDPEKTKNFVTELKFVDIDYSLFQHIKREPMDEYTGIEKGYEQYLDLDFVSDDENSSISEDSMSQDKSLSLGSDGSGEPYLTPIPQPKSDPNTLKSLRMFRPNLKRKTGEAESVPEKQLKTSSDINKPSTACSSSSYNHFTNSSSLSNYLSSSSIRPVLPNRTPENPLSATTKEETDSKNVVAATLLQLGGQVAINKQTIQVPNTLMLKHIPKPPFLEQKSSNLELIRLLKSKISYNLTKDNLKQLHNNRLTTYSKPATYSKLATYGKQATCSKPGTYSKLAICSKPANCKPTSYSNPTTCNKPSTCSNPTTCSKPTVTNYFSDNVDRLLSTAQLLEEMTDYSPECQQQPQKKPPPQNDLDPNMRGICPNISSEYLPVSNLINPEVIEVSTNNLKQAVELSEMEILAPHQMMSLEATLMEALEPSQISPQLQPQLQPQLSTQLPPQLSVQLDLGQQQIKNGPLDLQEEQVQETSQWENTRVATICTQLDTTKTITPTIVSDVLLKESSNDCQPNQVDISYQYEDISSSSEYSNQVVDNGSCKAESNGYFKYRDTFSDKSNDGFGTATENSCEYCDTSSEDSHLSFGLLKNVDILSSNTNDQISLQTKDIATVDNNNTVFDQTGNQNITSQCDFKHLNDTVPDIIKAIELIKFDNNKEIKDIIGTEKLQTNNACNQDIDVKVLNEHTTSSKSTCEDLEESPVLCDKVSDNKSESDGNIEKCHSNSFKPCNQSNTCENIKIDCEFNRDQESNVYLNGHISSNSRDYDLAQLVELNHTKGLDEIVHETDDCNDNTISNIEDISFQISQSNLNISEKYESLAEHEISFPLAMETSPDKIKFDSPESTNCLVHYICETTGNEDILNRSDLHSFSQPQLEDLYEKTEPNNHRSEDCTLTKGILNDSVSHSFSQPELNNLEDLIETPVETLKPKDEKSDPSTTTEEISDLKETEKPVENLKPEDQISEVGISTDEDLNDVTPQGYPNLLEDSEEANLDVDSLQPKEEKIVESTSPKDFSNDSVQQDIPELELEMSEGFMKIETPVSINLVEEATMETETSVSINLEDNSMDIQTPVSINLVEDNSMETQTPVCINLVEEGLIKTETSVSINLVEDDLMETQTPVSINLREEGSIKTEAPVSISLVEDGSVETQTPVSMNLVEDDSIKTETHVCINLVEEGAMETQTPVSINLVEEGSIKTETPVSINLVEGGLMETETPVSINFGKDMAIGDNEGEDPEYVIFDEHNYFRKLQPHEYQSSRSDSQERPVKNFGRIRLDNQDEETDGGFRVSLNEFQTYRTVDDMTNITYLENLDEITSVEADVFDLAMENNINIIDTSDVQQKVNSEEDESIDILREDENLYEGRKDKEFNIFNDVYEEDMGYQKLTENFVDFTKCEDPEWYTKTFPYDEFLPKNFNSTENIRRYSNTHRNRHVNVSCFKNDYDLSIIKNVNSNDTLCTICKGMHSSLKTNSFNLKELKVLLCRLPSNVTCTHSHENKVKKSYSKKYNFYERTKSPTRRCKKKRRDKSDIYNNYFRRSARKIRHRRVAPLLDVNLRYSTRRRIPKKRPYNCDYKNKFKNKKTKTLPSSVEELTEKECKLILEKIAKTNARVELQRLPVDVKECKKMLEKLVNSYPLVELECLPVGIKDCKVILENIVTKNKTQPPLNNKYYAKQILKNVPGLNDFEMLRPRNVNQIVNVVQISGGRPASSVTSQNAQTSTQVSPHIQRIGQPRVVEPKPETPITVSTSLSAPQNSAISTSSTIAKPATSQPSTLINILSQQIIRPNPNTVRNRTAPFINILSQQIIRPGTSVPSQKTTSNSVPTTANSTVSSTENHQNIIIKSEPFTIKSEPSFTIKSEPTFTVKSEPTFTIKTDPAVISSHTEVTTAPTEPPKILNSTIKSLTTPTATTSNPGGTILQFICKKTLPKFQQAFGKTVYQPSTETTNQPTVNIVETANTTPGNVDAKKIVPSKTIPVNMQPLQGNVIYRGQMPVGQTISLIPPGSTTRQLFRITGSTHEQISLVKETVIQNKMSALLAAALQGKPKVSEQNGEVVEEYSATRITLCRPNAVQGTRLVKPVQLQIPTNVIRTSPQPNLSSTTLEQLREFDMVYKQVKERSSSSVQPEVATSNVQLQTDNPESSPQQRISFTYVNQVQKYTQLSPVVVVSSYNNLQPAASPALSVTSQGSSSPCVTPASTPTLPKIASKTSKGKSLKTATTTANTAIKSAPNIPKPQQKPQEDEHTTQRIFDILAEYAEQLRNSPDLNNKPAPRRRSNPPTNPSSNSKRKKSSSKKSGQSNSSLEIDTEDLTMGSEDSSGGNIVQLSVTDDEQSQATSITPTESNSENSPTGPRQQMILTESNNPTPQNVIITDSSVGEALKMPNTALIVPGSYIMPVSMVKGTQQIAVVSGGSKILATVPARSGQNMLLFQSFLNQNKKGAISAVKYSAIQPVSGISSQSLAGVSAQPPVILPSNSVATAMALGQPITLKKLDEADRLNTELLLTISKPRETIVKIEDSPETPQPDSSTSLSSDSIDIKEENTSHSDSSSNEKSFNTFQKMNSVATSVIASCIKEGSIDDNASVNIISVGGNTSENKEGDQTKPTERMQSVLVSASNGPMLSHTTPRFRKQNEPATATVAPIKEQFLHNGEKRNPTEQKSYKPNTPTYYAGRIKKNPTNKKIDSEMQKQAAMERELRLQKSLSEECEDLGVDEPSTSDLFPEADLLFDSNHSPSYDQTSQDGKRPLQNPEIKETKSGMNLFSDDESSGPLRNDIFDYVASEYHAVETALNYQARQLMNGNNTSNESASSCEDSTLLPNCGTMSEVTLNSPISPETYSDATQPSLNKYKYKYTNRKKGERNKQTDQQQPVVEVSSSADSEAAKNEKEKEKNTNPTSCHPHISFEEELSDENFKVVRVAISKTDEKDEVKCQLHCDDDGKKTSRKSTKKSCSCCTGGPKGAGTSNSNIRKRPQVSRPQTPVALQHKKTFLSKKR